MLLENNFYTDFFCQKPDTDAVDKPPSVTLCLSTTKSNKPFFFFKINKWKNLKDRSITHVSLVKHKLNITFESEKTFDWIGQNVVKRFYPKRCMDSWQLYERLVLMSIDKYNSKYKLNEYE